MTEKLAIAGGQPAVRRPLQALSVESSIIAVARGVREIADDVQGVVVGTGEVTRVVVDAERFLSRISPDARGLRD